MMASWRSFFDIGAIQHGHAEGVDQAGPVVGEDVGPENEVVFIHQHFVGGMSADPIRSVGRPAEIGICAFPVADLLGFELVFGFSNHGQLRVGEKDGR